MERDFLGINLKKSEPLPVRDDENSAIYANPTRPYTNFVSFTSQPEENSNMFSQRSVNSEGNNYFHGSQSSYASGSRVWPQNSFASVPSINRDVPHRPTIADMTIFYAGKVFIFNNIPFEKAAEIVRLANSSSNNNNNNMTQNAVQNGILGPKIVHSLTLPPRPPLNISTEISLAPKTRTNERVPPGTEISLVPKIATNERVPCGALPLPPLSLSTEISLAPKSSTSERVTCGVVSTEISLAPQTGTSNESVTGGAQSDAPRPSTRIVVPQAIPQARKASLSRFLEKRKERMNAAMPYAFAKNSSENIYSGNSSENNVSENKIPEK